MIPGSENEKKTMEPSNRTQEHFFQSFTALQAMHFHTFTLSNPLKNTKLEKKGPLPGNLDGIKCFETLVSIYHQSSIINHQSSLIHHQSSIINHQLSSIIESQICKNTKISNFGNFDIFPGNLYPMDV